MAAQFKVIPEEWVHAGRGVGNASDELARGLDAFCRVVNAQPFGRDDLGRALFEGDHSSGSPGFAQRRDGLLTDLCTMVNLLRTMAGGLVAAGGWYVAADGTIAEGLGGRPNSAARSDLPDGVREYRLPQVADELPSTVSPPAIVLQAAWILEAVGLGFPWPDGDIDGVETLRAAASALGIVIDEVAQQVAVHTGRVTGSGFGDATDAFGSVAQRVAGGYLPEQTHQSVELAKYCGAGAHAIVMARSQCLASAMFMVGLIAAVSTLGPFLEEGLAAVLPLIRLEGLALRITVRLTYEAVVGSAFSGGLNVIDQLFRTGEVDLGELGGALGEGALMGAMMGGAHAGLPPLMRRAPALTRLAGAMETPGWKGMLPRFLTGGAVATGTMATTGAVTGHGWDWTNAAKMGFGMAFVGTGSEAVTYLRDSWRLTGAGSSPPPGPAGPYPSLAGPLGELDPIALGHVDGDVAADGPPHVELSADAGGEIRADDGGPVLNGAVPVHAGSSTSSTAPADAPAPGPVTSGHVPAGHDGGPDPEHDDRSPSGDRDPSGAEGGGGTGQTALSDSTGDPRPQHSSQPGGAESSRSAPRADQPPAPGEPRPAVTDPAKPGHIALVLNGGDSSHPAASAFDVGADRQLVAEGRAVLDRLAPMGTQSETDLRALAHLDRIAGPSRIRVEPLRDLAIAVDLDGSVKALVRVFNEAQLHGYDPAGAADRPALLRILRAHQEADPDLWRGARIADRPSMADSADSIDNAGARALGRMQKIVDGSGPQRAHDGGTEPLVLLTREMDLGTSTAVLARLFNDAQAHGLDPAGARDRDELINILGAHVSSDPVRWDCFLVADRLGIHGADDGTARTLAQIHHVIDRTSARRSRLNAESFTALADDLALDSVEQLVRLFEDAQTDGFDPARAVDGVHLAEILDAFAATDPTWNATRAAERYGIHDPDGVTILAVGRIIKIAGRTLSPYVALDPVVRLADELNLRSVGDLVRLFIASQERGFDPTTATDPATLAEALRRYRDPGPRPGNASSTPGDPGTSRSDPPVASTPKAARESAAAKVAEARLALKDTPAGTSPADRLVATDMARERLDSLIARVDALDRWPSRPEVSYTTDYDAFYQDYVDALARAARGDPVIPYLYDNATGGLGSREHGRPFGWELEFDGPTEIRGPIARDVKAAGLAADPDVHEYHASKRVGYSEAPDSWRLETDPTVTAELVSPTFYDTPLTWQALERSCFIIQSHGGWCSINAGGHITIGIPDFDHIVGNHRGVVEIVDSFADTLYRLGQNPSRNQHRGLTHCKPNYVLTDPYLSIGDFQRPDRNRNAAVNMNSVAGKPTDHIEFRFPDGSLDPSVIQTQTKILLGVTEAALRNAGGPYSPGHSESLGTHARERRMGRYSDDPFGVGPKETESFRRLMDLIFHRRVDKAQATALFAATRWNAG